MTKQIVNLGVANKGNGDPIRTAFDKVNQNFTELYNAIGLGDGNLNIGAFEFSGSTMTTTDSSDIVIAQRTQITSNLTVQGDILPQTANGGDLGSSARPWKSLYVSNNTVYLGGVPLSLEPGTNELRVNNVPISQNITYTDIPNAPRDVSDLTDDEGLLGGGAGGGLSITDFGLGFTDTLDAGKITTSKLYNENPNQGLNNQYTLEVTDGGVVALPDGSIINGATLKTIAGNYAGITAGPNGADEDSWVWVDNNGATIATKYSTDNHTWTFNNNGGLTFPQGTFLGYSDPGGFIIDGAVDKDIAIYTYSGADAHGWTFGTDGALTFPDNTIQTTAYTGQTGGDTTVVRQDTPPTASNGTLWFNTLEGRLYIKYSDVWVDAAPLMMPAPDTDIDVASITFPDATVQTTAFTGTAVTDRLVNGVHELVLESNGNLTIPGAITNDNGIEMITDRGTVQFGYNLEVPGVASHFHINKVGSFDLFLGDDSDYVKLPSNGGVEIQAGQGLWTFGTDSALTVPGDIRSEGNINIDINLSDSTLRRWRFGEDGDTVFPNNVSIDYSGNNVQFPRIIADSGKAFSVQGQGSTGSAALSWTVDPDAAGQYAAVGVTKEGGDNLAKVILQAQSDSGDAATVKLWKFDETGALTIPGDIRSEGAINIDINLSDSTLRRWRFGEDGDLTFPDATVQTTAHIQGEQIFTVDTGSTDYAPTAIDFNLLVVTPAAGYSEIDPISVTLPAGVPGQRLVIFNSFSLVTLQVIHGLNSRDISGGVIAECIYSSEGWIPLYGTNSPT